MPTPVVTNASWVAGHRLDVTFSDGARKVIDFSPWLIGPVFEPLRLSELEQLEEAGVRRVR